MSAASVRCSHILVKHTGSRRPSSWRCPTVTLTKAQAIEKLTKIREGIVAGAAVFEAVARVESDCSSAEHGGDLGAFTRGKMQKPFEDASFGLQVGELSGIVVRAGRGARAGGLSPCCPLLAASLLCCPPQYLPAAAQDTDSGVHIIKRTA